MIANLKTFLLIVGAGVILSACASNPSTIYPMGKNTFKVVTLADNLADANQESMDKANGVCDDYSMMPSVIEAKSTPLNDEDSDYTYQASVKFKCVAKPGGSLGSLMGMLK